MKASEVVGMLREATDILGMFATFISVLDENEDLDMPTSVINDMMKIRDAIDNAKDTTRMMANLSILSQGEGNE